MKRNGVKKTATHSKNRTSLRRLLSKANVCLALLFFITCICNAQDKKIDWEKDGLKGKVKSIAAKYYKAMDKFGSISKGVEVGGVCDGNILTEYDNDGYITKHIHSYCVDATTFIDTVLFGYDNNYNVISINSKTYYCESHHSESLVTHFKYNDSGKKIEESEYKSDGSLIRKYIYKYDDKGNRIEISQYKSDGSLRGKYICKYDDKGNEIERSWYKSDGSLDWKCICRYDYKGNEVERSWYKPDGSLDWTCVYKYDDKGNKIEESEYKPDGSNEWKDIYKYDDKENNEEKNRYKYDESFKKGGKYNSHGDITEDESNGYEYKYDKQGNWIEKITYKGEARIPEFITERKIEYYE